MQTPPVAQVVARDVISHVEEPRQAVARTDAEWVALWKLHAGDKPLPAVDLKTRTVVAIFLGTRSSAGYGAEIVSVRSQQGTTVVRWTEKRPAPGTVSAQVITSPALIATVPRISGEIRFEKVEP
jgi:hypothetical protein